jgi:hypothetical protein
VSVRKKTLLLLSATLLAYGVLVSTHLGEFWPFSIFPMFSKAGGAWSRAIVRDVPADGGVSWESMAAASSLPGEPFPLLDHGMNAIDLSHFVWTEEAWDSTRLDQLHRLFAPYQAEHRLLVVRVDGRTDDGDSVVIAFTPLALLTADAVELNPRLAPSGTAPPARSAAPRPRLDARDSER